MVDNITLKKLAFIKYLVFNANNQTQLSEPLNSSALLTYQDAVELFLDMLALKLSIRADRLRFMDYFVKINEVLQNRRDSVLSQTEGMRKLNRARVALKHEGIHSSKTTLLECSILTNSFFEENVKRFFDLDFKDINLIELISDSDAKNYLNKAVEAKSKNNQEETIKYLAFAFDFLLKNYESSKRNEQPTVRFAHSAASCGVSKYTKIITLQAVEY